MSDIVTRERTVWPGWLTRGVPEWFRGFDLPADWFDRDGMRLEEHRTDDMLVVRAEIPGIDPDKDVEITLEDGTLCIRAERRESHEETDEDSGRYRSEFRYGSFSRRLPLPAGANEADVEAAYGDGILEIKVPLGPGVEGPRKVPVARPATSGGAS